MAIILASQRCSSHKEIVAVGSVSLVHQLSASRKSSPMIAVATRRTMRTYLEELDRNGRMK